MREWRSGLRWAIGVVGCLLLVATPSIMASAQVIARVSVTSAGEPANKACTNPSVSGDGRYVVFESEAMNLARSERRAALDPISEIIAAPAPPIGPAYEPQVFLHDRVTGRTRLVSRSNYGPPANLGCLDPCISADGSTVAFWSAASNLVRHDTNDTSDVFVRNLSSGRTRRVSISSAGAQANGWSTRPSLSVDGRYVAFDSSATNLVPDDTNRSDDVFVHDRRTGETVRVSVTSAGEQGDGGGEWPAINADGRCIAFSSQSNNLAPGAADHWKRDVFVHDRLTGQTTMVHVSSFGEPGNGWCSHYYGPAISADGQLVAFESDATNLSYGCVPPFLDHLYVHNRRTGETQRITPTTRPGPWWSYGWQSSLSGDGRFVCYTSGARAIVPDDTNGNPDVFVHDRVTGRTARVSIRADGAEVSRGGSQSEISKDGRFVVFASSAPNLVPDGGGPRASIFIAKNPLYYGEPPKLCRLGTNGYLKDGVRPNAGMANSTLFRFKVKVTDADGDRPELVRLIIRKHGLKWQTHRMMPMQGSTITGLVYSCNLTLPAGQYEHRFRARDKDGWGTGAAKQIQAGPIVSAAASGPIASVAAVPAGSGAEIILTLSGASTVDVRVRNIAGRLVRSICQDRDCEAGRNTLLWNATDGSGLPAPAGIYVVEIAARSPDGSASRSMTAVNLQPR